MKFHPTITALTLASGLLVSAALAQGPTTTAVDDTVNTTITRGPLSINTLLVNDTDPENDALTIILPLGTPQFGKAVFRDGAVVYTPNRFFQGTDSFSYTINDRPNGLGSSSTATVFIRNPFLLGRGVYASSLSGTGGSHDVSGYFNAGVGPSGDFTATFRFAGSAFRFKGRFDASGNFSGEITRPGQPAIQLALLYAINGEARQISGTVTVGAETVQFLAPRLAWSNHNPAPTAGRYTIILPAPDALPGTPQGTGYCIATVTRSGVVSMYGRAGDDRAFSSSTFLGEDGATVPLYGSIRPGGSIFGDLFIDGSTNSRENEPLASVAGTLRWFTSRDAKRFRFPNGFDRSVEARGGLYIEPEPGTSVLEIQEPDGFNSSFTVSAGDLRAPRTERAAIGERPIAGHYDFAFDNTKRIGARMRVIARTGIFAGSFYDRATRRAHRISGVFLQNENTAYGIWNSKTKTGRVELTPDLPGN